MKRGRDVGKIGVDKGGRKEGMRRGSDVGNIEGDKEGRKEGREEVM